MQSMKVMTYNLKFAVPDPPNSWAQRRPVVAEMLRSVSPDIIGTQEGLYQQIKDIKCNCPEYDWIGLGRDGGSRGEFCAIFYRSDRFEPLEFDHFWLSDTPDVVASRTWGNINVRMATWVRFRDCLTGAEFYCVNTHLDHNVQMAKEKGARLILDRIENSFDPSLPVIFTGDFNAIALTDPVYDILTRQGGFSDTWYTSKTHIGPDYATFHNYSQPELNGPHIDWILTRGSIEAESTGVVLFSIDGQYPSDHCPVVCTLLLH
ncbi:MAG: endonuclease/exonuclease/phosphatase family protein [Armatimonadota bacterium]